MTDRAPQAADDAFWKRVAKRTAGIREPTLLMAKLPRAAGAIDWYVLRTDDDIVAARDQVRPGSYLTAYFDWRLSLIEGPDGRQRARERARSLVPPDELLGITRSTNAPAVDVTYIADVAEFDEWIAERADQPSWLADFPPVPLAGIAAEQGVVADGDGALRRHPY